MIQTRYATYATVIGILTLPLGHFFGAPLGLLGLIGGVFVPVDLLTGAVSRLLHKELAIALGISLASIISTWTVLSVVCIGLMHTYYPLGLGAIGIAINVLSLQFFRIASRTIPEPTEPLPAERAGG